MAISDLPTLLDRLEQGTLSNEARQQLQGVLTELVRLTLDRQGRENLQEKVDEFKYGIEDVAEAAAQAKAAVRNNGEYELDPDDIAILGPYYCDRLYAGVDEWPSEDQDKWIDACEIVTELAASVISR